MGRKYKEIIPKHPGEIRPSQLARIFQVPRSTVQRDLPALEEQGTLLIESERGLSSLFKRR